MTAQLQPAEMFARLARAGVVYVVIGGFAMIAHGVVRVTNDLDICPAPERENLRRLAGFLTDVGAVQLGVAEGAIAAQEMPFDHTNPEHLAQGGNFRLDTDLGVLDVMQWIPGIDADHAYPILDRHAMRGRVGQATVSVCSLQHLRLMKRTAGRPQDLLDLANLAAAHPESP